MPRPLSEKQNPLGTLKPISEVHILLEAARRSPLVKRIVVASSDKAYGERSGFLIPRICSKGSHLMMYQKLHRFDCPGIINIWSACLHNTRGNLTGGDLNSTESFPDNKERYKRRAACNKERRKLYGIISMSRIVVQAYILLGRR